MKVLVTGVAGFIGSNLAHALLDDGHEVVGYDNLSQGNRLNMAEFSSHSKFQFQQADILDAKAFKQAGQGCQAIYHLAAFKIPRFGNAYDTLNINTAGTANAIESALQNNSLLIFSSTSDVYGKNPKIPFTEEHDLVLGPPTVRRWAYAMSKAFDEQLIFAEAERRGLKFSIARFFGGYGPNQNLTWWGGPQSVFINQALAKKPIPLHGDGMQTRSFTYVLDHVSGLIKMLNTPESRGEVFNLGNDREITIRDLATMIWNKVQPGLEPMIEMIPYAQFGKYEDVQRRVPDLTKSRRVLKFEPVWELERGLDLTIEWQKERMRQLEVT